MIYKFRILSNEEEKFMREIDVPANITFLDLHKAVQEAVGYDQSQMCSFFISDENWEKGIEITLFDMGDTLDQEKKVMENSIISDCLKKSGQRLLYVFDFFSERAFFIELVQLIENPKDSTDIIVCVKSEGKAPEQIKIDNIMDDTLGLDFDDDDFSDEWDQEINIDDLEDY